MKIGIDLDATISAYPEFFKLFTSAMKKVGSEIYVLTDRIPGTEDEVAGELYTFGITYDKIKIAKDKAGSVRA